MFTSLYQAGIAPGALSNGIWYWEVDGGYFKLDAYSPTFECESYRVVSGGVKVTPVVSLMNSQGYINVIEIPPFSGDPPISIDTKVRTFPSYETLPLKSSKSIYGLMRPAGPTSREFRGVKTGLVQNLTAAEINTGDWSSILVTCEGAAPSSVVAIVDIYINIEVTLQPNSPLGYLTTKAPPASPTLTRVSNNITQSTAVIVGTDATVDKGFMANAWDGLKSAGNFLISNGKNIAHLGMAGAYAYSGNALGAAANLAQIEAGSHSHPMSVD